MNRAMTLFASILIHLFLVLLIFNFNLQKNSNQILEIGLSETKEETPHKNKSLFKQKGQQEQSEKTAPTESEQPAPRDETTLNADQNQNIDVQNQSAEADYASYLFQEISRRKSYPALAQKLKHHGQILTKISIARDGKVLSAKILKSSQSDLLNQEVERLLGSLIELKKFPDKLQKESWDFIVPIEFNLQN